MINTTDSDHHEGIATENSSQLGELLHRIMNFIFFQEGKVLLQSDWFTTQSGFSYLCTTTVRKYKQDINKNIAVYMSLEDACQDRGKEKNYGYFEITKRFKF